MKRGNLQTVLCLTLLVALAVSVPVGAQVQGRGGLDPGQVETIRLLPDGDSPEGIAVDLDGTVYVGNRPHQDGLLFAEILKISPQGAVSLFATLGATANPLAEGLLGLAIDWRGDVYAALVTFEPESHGVWRIRSDGTESARVPGSEWMVFPNALTFGPTGELYVTDSILGQVWRYSESEMILPWAHHELLQPYPEDPLGIPLPGANGIAFYPPNNLYVANTEKGLIARVPIRPDGMAGTAELVAWDQKLLTIDGIKADVTGNIHGLVPGFSLTGSSPLVRVNPQTGAIADTVSDPDEVAKFDVPLSLAFDVLGLDRKSVLVTNGALRIPGLPIGPGPGVVQVGIGVPGFPE